MTTVITIESNIPLPTRAGKPRAPKYPIADLQVGQSFYVGISRAALYTHALKVAKATGRKFVVREEGEEGARIWRKA